MTCATCCSYPNGYITIAPGITSFVAFILTSISIWSCQYAGTSLTSGSKNIIGVGLFYREKDDDYTGFWNTPSNDNACTWYSSYSYSTQELLDSKFEAAQGFGLAAWMCGFVMSMIAWTIAPCCACPKNGWGIIGGLFIMVGSFQLLTLLILASNVCSRGCDLKGDGIVGIFAFILWYVSAAICFMVPEPRIDQPSAVTQTATATPVQMEMPAAVMASETTTTRVEADGTTVTETITTNPDGTTKVTTCIIPPATVVALPPDANFEKV